MNYKKIQKNKGYTLLFAVLVSSVVLSVGISILTISKKEFLLSSSARESINAFYAADSGIECALYQDQTNNLFATTSGNASIIIPSTSGCMNMPINASSTQNHALTDYSFKFDIKMQNSAACASIFTDKVLSQDGYGNWLSTTTITSKGYNIGWNTGASTCSDPSPRRVERALKYTI